MVKIALSMNPQSGVLKMRSEGGIWSGQGFEALGGGFPGRARVSVASVPGLRQEWVWLVAGLEHSPGGPRAAFGDGAELGVCVLFSEPQHLRE